jgi:hypothetical protein
MVITSMNLHAFSELNNREMGVSVDTLDVPVGKYEFKVYAMMYLSLNFPLKCASF